MTAVKCKQEYKTLLDFSKSKRRVSKNLVKKLLRQVEVTSYREDNKDIIHTSYHIIVDNYKIRLILNPLQEYGCAAPAHKNNTLKQYGSFMIELSEKLTTHYKSINPRDYRFKTQYWVEFLRPTRINDLVNAVVYCSRLSNLKAFL